MSYIIFDSGNVADRVVGLTSAWPGPNAEMRDGCLCREALYVFTS